MCRRGRLHLQPRHRRHLDSLLLCGLLQLHLLLLLLLRRLLLGLLLGPCPIRASCVPQQAVQVRQRVVRAEPPVENRLRSTQQGYQPLFINQKQRSKPLSPLPKCIQPCHESKRALATLLCLHGRITGQQPYVVGIWHGP